MTSSYPTYRDWLVGEEKWKELYEKLLVIQRESESCGVSDVLCRAKCLVSAYAPVTTNDRLIWSRRERILDESRYAITMYTSVLYNAARSTLYIQFLEQFDNKKRRQIEKWWRVIVGEHIECKRKDGIQVSPDDFRTLMSIWQVAARIA